MKATLKVEVIGNESRQFRFYQSMCEDIIGKSAAKALIGHIPSRHYVAEIIGTDPHWIYRRNFIRAKYDYKHSNSIGSRGVYAWYIIESGKIYEVKSPTSWKSSDKFYCTVDPASGDIVKIDKKEVDRCLKNHSE